MVSQVLIRRWADKDEFGAPRVRAVTVGTGEVNHRAHPQNVMTGRGHVPPQYVSELEQAWQYAENRRWASIRGVVVQSGRLDRRH